MGEQYVWFEGVRVASDDVFALHCIVNGQKVPLPVAILHPDCTLRESGDTGKLGVPMTWALGWGLIPKPPHNDLGRDGV